jgi:hypothetical protein
MKMANIEELVRDVKELQWQARKTLLVDLITAIEKGGGGEEFKAIAEAYHELTAAATDI